MYDVRQYSALGELIMSGEKDEEFLSVLYHALRTHRRRRVIRILAETEDKSVTVRCLARRIASTEHDIPRAQATGEPYRNVYNALTQTHLPVLADTDIISYNSSRQTVSPSSNLQIAVLLVIINASTVQIIQKDTGNNNRFY